MHEVGHLEQSIRRQLAGPGRGRESFTVLPDPEKRRNRVQDWKPDREKRLRGSPTSKHNRKGYKDRVYRAGRRGRPSMLGNDDYSDNEFREYLGTRDEIEAHAMGTAASMVAEWRKEQSRYSDYNNQRNLNAAIDDMIEGLK